MPYVYDPNLDQQNQQNQSAGNSGSSVSISGASPTVNSNASSQAQGSNTNQSQGLNTGSGFTNLDKYLQNNDAQGFGNKVIGKVSDQIQGAQDQMKQASDSFTNKVNATSSNIPNMEQVNSAIANPTSADPTQFKSWENTSYGGPKSLGESQSDWNKYWSGVNNAQTSTKELGSDAGRFTLLDNYFGKPSYNYGEKSLDNLLFQQSGAGAQTQKLQDQATQLQTQGAQGANALADQAAKQVGKFNDARTQVRNAIGIDDNGNVLTGANAGAIGKQYADVNSQVDAANAQRAQQFSDFQNDFKNNSLTAGDIAAMGLKTGQNVFNVDLSKYLSSGDALNKDQVMTPQQRAYIQALSNMAGVNDTFASGLASNPTSAFKYDSTGANAAIQSARNNYENAVNNTSYGFTAQDGSQQSATLPQMQAAVAQAQQMLSQDPNGASHWQDTIDRLSPLIAQHQKDLDAQYGANNSLGVQGNFLGGRKR